MKLIDRFRSQTYTATWAAGPKDGHTRVGTHLLIWVYAARVEIM